MRNSKLAAIFALSTAIASTATFSRSFSRNSAASRSGQEPALVSLTSEPHHHLALHNVYVNVYQVEVQPRDFVHMHRHDTDAISLSLGDSLVTVRSPGKPDAPQKLTTGQIRLQALGLVHSTSVDGDATFRNVTVELLLPQTGKQNRCAQVMAGQPLHCPDAQTGKTLGLPQFETDQTYVGLITVRPHETIVLGDAARSTLIVAIDGGAKQKDGMRALPSGDFVWLDHDKAGMAFKNDSDMEVRLVSFTFKAGSARE